MVKKKCFKSMYFLSDLNKFIKKEGIKKGDIIKINEGMLLTCIYYYSKRGKE